MVTRTGEEALLYRVSGQVFFASADLLVEVFDVREIEGRPVTIELGQAHFWDVTSVTALDRFGRGCANMAVA